MADFKRNKTTVFAVVTVLMLATSAALINMPNVNALTNVNFLMQHYVDIGVDSPTLIAWIPSPNLLATSPAYVGKTSVWPNATVTFTRPDGSKDVVNGPFNMRPSTVQDASQMCT